MAMTLEDYDRHVGHHLRMVNHHATSILTHVGYMTHQPDFETTTEENLGKVADVLAKALAEVNCAIQKFRDKPRDS
jgi:hypothetical protein